MMPWQLAVVNWNLLVKKNIGPAWKRNHDESFLYGNTDHEVFWLIGSRTHEASAYGGRDIERLLSGY